MEKERNIIRNSIEQISYILNHWTNLPQNGQPPYSPLRKETLRSLEEQLELLKKYLAEMEEVRKNELKLAGLKNFIIPREIKIISDESKWLEPKWLEPILLEPKWLEPKVLKPRPHKKSDGWRTPNKNPRGPVCRY